MCQNKMDINRNDSVYSQLQAVKMSAMLMHHHIILKTEKNTLFSDADTALKCIRKKHLIRFIKNNYQLKT